MSRFRLTSPRVQLTENQVEKACLDLVQHHGYWPIRQHVGRYLHADREVIRALHEAGVRYRMITLGEPGLPDWAFLHGTRPGFLLEAKRPGAKLDPAQERMQWMLRQAYHLQVVTIDSVLALEAWLAGQAPGGARP